MINYLNEEQPNLIAVKVSGKLEKSDYDTFIPKVDELVKRFDTINLYWEMSDFDGWDVQGALKDLKLDFKYLNNFGRVAMVGARKWEKALTGFMDTFSTAQVRYFELEEAESAKDWVKDKTSA